MQTFNDSDIEAFQADAKVGILSTIDPDGLPHLTLITSLEAKNSKKLVWGQFTEGLSKEHVINDQHTAFLIMSLDKKMWRGKAKWTHSSTEGVDYETFNNKPMFRYNSYFGVHTVHYMDLTEYDGEEKLPLLNIILSSLITKLYKFNPFNLKLSRL